MWFLIGLMIFIIILGMISSAVERERDEEFIEETAEQLGRAAEWWYGKKGINSYVASIDKVGLEVGL